MKWFLAVGGLLFLGACAQHGGESLTDVGGTSSQPLQPPALSASLSASFDPQGTQSVSDVRSATLTATVLGAKGPLGAMAEFVAPSGELFDRQVETLFGSAFDAQTVQFSLPVAGTTIDHSGFSGTWTARFRAGNQLLATQTFELQP